MPKDRATARPQIARPKSQFNCASCAGRARAHATAPRALPLLGARAQRTQLRLADAPSSSRRPQLPAPRRPTRTRRRLLFTKDYDRDMLESRLFRQRLGARYLATRELAARMDAAWKEDRWLLS